MTCAPSIGGRSAFRFSSSARRAIRSSSSSWSCSSLRRTGHVAGRAVRAGQLVQPIQQRPGVAHVAADGAVGPAVAVPVEPEVELDQLADILDHRVGVVQLAASAPRPSARRRPRDDGTARRPARSTASSACRCRAAAPARRSTRSRLAPLHDGVRVPQHVLVLVDRVLLELQRGQLREEQVGQARLDDQRQTRRRLRADEQPVELGVDPLGATRSRDARASR